MAHADLSGRNKFWGNCHARPAPSTKNILGKIMTNDKRNTIMDRIIINQWSVISIQWTYEGWSIRASKKNLSYLYDWLHLTNWNRIFVFFMNTEKQLKLCDQLSINVAYSPWSIGATIPPTDLCKTLIPLMSIKCTYSSTVESAMLLVARYIYYV